MKNKYEFRNSNDVAIFLNRRNGTPLEALISAEDFGLVDSFKGTWCAKWEPHNKDFYVQINLKPKNLSLHRVLTNAQNGELVDHINGMTLDNRRSNLRICTSLENARNRKTKPNTLSKYKGVYWHKSSKGWLSRIVVNGKQKHLGVFSSETDAAEAYNEEAKNSFGDFAFLNKLA